MGRTNPMQEWIDAREALRTGDHLCPSCGYNLRGNRTGRCPECGQDVHIVDLVHGQAERPRPPWRRLLPAAGPRIPLLLINAGIWAIVHFVPHTASRPLARIALTGIVLIGLCVWHAIEWGDGIPATPRRFWDAAAAVCRGEDMLTNTRSALRLAVPGVVLAATLAHMALAAWVVLH